MNLDNFFQEQNEKFILPNTSADAHWQQMQLQLAPKATNYKPYLIAAGIVALGIITTLVIRNNDKDKHSGTVVANTTTPNNTTTTPTPIIEPNTNTVAPVVATRPTVLQKPVIKKETNNSVNNTINKNTDFYIDLAKAPELFTIDPTKENTLICKQGTTLLIPANSIIDKNGQILNTPISVTVQEYYRYDGTNANDKATAGMLKYLLYNGEEQVKVQTGKTVVIKMSNGLAQFKLIENADVLSEQQLQKMNWISNEKFFSDTRKKITYRITLDKKYDANTFMSQIAFTKHNALLPGNIENNSLVFENIPVGENIYFISLGKIDNKYFSCSKKLVTGNTNVTTLDFVEISESTYQQQVEMYGKLGKGD